MYITATQKTLFTICFAVCLSINVHASDKKKNNTKDEIHAKNEMVVLSGKAIDAQTGEALSGVAITLTGLNKTVYTDFDGNFTVDDLQPGKYNLTANLITYKETSLEKYAVQKSKTNRITFSLNSKY